MGLYPNSETNLRAIRLFSILDLARWLVGDIASVSALLSVFVDRPGADGSEAIGHLGTSEKAAEIFQLLKRLAASDGSVAGRAIVGRYQLVIIFQQLGQ